MQGGDISNETPPRFLFVFEGLIARIPDALVRLEKMHVRFHRYVKAAALWEVDDQALSYTWDMAWRHHLAVDIVTFLPYHQEIRTRLDDEGVPYGHLRHYASPEVLAWKLAYMPYVHRIYYAWPEREFIFGDRGVYTPTQTTFNPLT